MNAMKNPLPIDQGLAFQTHALQMILLGPFCVRTQHCYGPPRIVTLQNLLIFKFLVWVFLYNEGFEIPLFGYINLDLDLDLDLR